MSDYRNIPFSPPDITDAEIEEVALALRSGWITTGPRTKELEKRLAEYIGTNRVVCLNSATAAEELNLRVLGVGEGDEVIVPAYTYTATASAAIHVGAKVVFIDSQSDSWEMDYDAMEAAITEKTKAIVPVDLGGVMCDYNRIMQAVERKRHIFRSSGHTELGKRIQSVLGRVAVVSDCAHSLGASRNGKNAGMASDFASFSFHAVKNLTTAEGGAATWKSLDAIDDEEIYHAYQLYSLHGQSKDALAKTKVGAWEYDIVGTWYKCNMTDIAAAIGLRQLDRYPAILQRRREIIERYDEALDRIGVGHLRHFGNDSRSSGHLYLTRVPNIDEAQRNAIIEAMGEKGIACNVHYKPLPMMTAYKTLGWDIKDFPNAYAYYRNLISLPLHTKLSDEDVEYIIDNFSAIVRQYLPKSMGIYTTSSYAMIPINVYKDNVDFCMASAQKGIMGMTGLSFIIGKKSIIEASKNFPKRSYYCNLYMQYDYFERTGEMHFTPPVQTIYAAKQALIEYWQEGEDAKWHRHQRTMEAIHKGEDKLGLKEVLGREVQSGLVSAVKYPDDSNWDFEKVHDYCYKRGFTIYPGKIEKQGTFRLCALGAIDETDIEEFWKVFETALYEYGIQIPVLYNEV